jgi:hypothetical protein
LIDELRIWNKAPNIEHIRQMMNQEIKLDGGDDVMGEIIPIKNLWTRFKTVLTMTSYFGQI